MSPGIVHLVGKDAPSRAILCAGAGHFAAAHVTLTEGVQIGGGENAADAVSRSWSAIVDRSGEIVPEYGFTQAEREVAAAQAGSGEVLAPAQ